MPRTLRRTPVRARDRPGRQGARTPASKRRRLHAGPAGVRLAKRVTRVFDSWLFIVAQTALAVAWAVLSHLTPEDRWVPGPLLALALTLGPQAAYAAPVVLLSQIRLADTARIDAKPRTAT